MKIKGSPNQSRPARNGQKTDIRFDPRDTVPADVLEIAAQRLVLADPLGVVPVLVADPERQPPSESTLPHHIGNVACSLPQNT